MDETTDAVALLEGLFHGWTDFFDDAGVVAAHEAVAGAEAVLEVLPVGGVEGNVDDFDEDVVVAQLGEWPLDDGGAVVAVGDEGFLGGHFGGLEAWSLELGVEVCGL